MIRKYLPSKRQCVDFTHITKIGKNRCYLRKVNNVGVVPYGIYAILKAVKINFEIEGSHAPRNCQKWAICP